MAQADTWYIMKQSNGQCAIVPESQLPDPMPNLPPNDRWGPYASQQEAIARRVGLIRAGKCQPA